MSIKLHLIAPFHSRVIRTNSSCAFAAGNVLPFAKMMHGQGSFHVVEYHSGALSDSDADEHVSVLTDEQWVDHWGDSEGNGISPTMWLNDKSSHGHQLFSANLLREMNRRISPEDIVCHSYGDAHKDLVWNLALKVRHVEIAIGYDRPPFGPEYSADRVFPSQAWRHFSFGKYPHSVEQMLCSTVIPHYFDTEDWPYETSPTRDYILFAGRLNRSKYGKLPELVRAMRDWKWKIAGKGETGPFEGLDNVELVGSVKGKDRAALYGNAACIVCPTEFVEPFGAVAIEAALCGTPVVGPDYGAYVETLGLSSLGWMAESPDEWASTIREAIEKSDRENIAARARMFYSLDVVGKQYATYFNRKA
jgi:glycosyltransferase involved in cell wall biosynthesis